MRQEGLCQWKIPKTPSGIEPATCWLVAQCLSKFDSTAYNSQADVFQQLFRLLVWFVVSLVGRSVGWLVGWFMDCFIYLFIYL